jgi:hypothetical protein
MTLWLLFYVDFLGNVNMDVRNMLPLLLAKAIYDKKKKDKNKSSLLGERYSIMLDLKFIFFY